MVIAIHSFTDVYNLWVNKTRTYKLCYSKQNVCQRIAPNIYLLKLRIILIQYLFLIFK